MVVLQVEPAMLCISSRALCCSLPAAACKVVAQTNNVLTVARAGRKARAIWAGVPPFERHALGREAGIATLETKMNNETPVGAASVEIDGELFTFAGDLERDSAAENRALASGVEVLDARAPYAPKLATSYFADLRNAARGDAGAVERLRQHAELRDLTSTTATAGAEFAPPNYLRDTYVEAIRSSAPLLNILTKRPLPEEGVSVVHPKLTTGASVASQTDGNSLSETDPVTTSVTLPVLTVGGFVDLSAQLFERSAPGLDQVIAQDLARAYYERLDSLAIEGSPAALKSRGCQQSVSRDRDGRPSALIRRTCPPDFVSFPQCVRLRRFSVCHFYRFRCSLARRRHGPSKAA